MFDAILELPRSALQLAGDATQHAGNFWKTFRTEEKKGYKKDYEKLARAYRIAQQCERRNHDFSKDVVHGSESNRAGFDTGSIAKTLFTNTTNYCAFSAYRENSTLRFFCQASSQCRLSIGFSLP